MCGLALPISRTLALGVESKLEDVEDSSKLVVSSGMRAELAVALCLTDVRKRNETGAAASEEGED